MRTQEEAVMVVKLEKGSEEAVAVTTRNANSIIPAI